MEKHSLAGGGFCKLILSLFRGGVLLGQGCWSFPRCSSLLLDLAFFLFLSLGSGFGLPGLIAIFLLHLDMFPLVSTYNAKKALFLKSKVC